MTKQKWPSLLTIVRHGKSQQNEAWDLLDEGMLEKMIALRDVRDADIKLSYEGMQQAIDTGTYLALKPQYDICFSSPFVRAMQTARNMITQLPYDLNVYEDENLREKEFGILHGMTPDEIKTKYPEEFEARKRDGKYRYRLKGGENYLDVKKRVHDFSDMLARKWSAKRVLVVTHQVPALLFRAQFERLNEDGVLALDPVPNCGIQTYKIDFSRKPAEGTMKLDEWNKVAY